jgi:hypothetical protein
MIRDAFINGLTLNSIRLRLLENITLDLDTAFDQARSLDATRESSNLYSQQVTPGFSAAVADKQKSDTLNKENSLAAISSVKSKSSCWFCGNSRHPLSSCPAHNAVCHKCKKPGHFVHLYQLPPTLTSMIATAVNKSFCFVCIIEQNWRYGTEFRVGGS